MCTVTATTEEYFILLATLMVQVEQRNVYGVRVPRIAFELSDSRSN